MKQVESPIEDWIQSLEPHSIERDGVLNFQLPLFVVLGSLFTEEELVAAYEKVTFGAGQDALDPEDDEQTAQLESEILELTGQHGLTFTELFSVEWDDTKCRGNISLLIAKISTYRLVVIYDLNAIPSFRVIAISKNTDLIQWLCQDPKLKLPRLGSHDIHLRHIAVRSPLPWSFLCFSEVVEALIGTLPQAVEVQRTDLLMHCR